ncbi:hypothetical protein RQP46_006119 [Phenoliferia psychrophenolica]
MYGSGGILGLAFSSIAASRTVPFVQNLVAQRSLDSNLFGFYLTRGTATGPVLTIGAVDPTHYTGSINYTPVTSQTYWQVAAGKTFVNGVAVGSPYAAAIDTGTTQDIYTYPCAYTGTIALTFSGIKVMYTINKADFNLGTTGNSQTCVGGIIGGTFSSNGPGTGASTPLNPKPAGAEFSALKTLVEVSLGLSSLPQDPEAPSRGDRAVSAPPPPPRQLGPAGGGAHSRFNPDASIVVIGMRGGGKTTLGVIMATYLSRPFIDADRLLERLFSITVRDMVLEKGWDYFRDREAAVLQQLLRVQGTGHVIVLGGGVVERESNRLLLSEYARTRGPVINVSRQMADVFAYSHRSATKSTWAAFDEEGRVIWNRRLPWYAECSNLDFVTLSRPTGASHPSLSLKHVESAIQRLVRATVGLPTPFVPFVASWSSARSAALVLGAHDAALSDASELELVTRGAEAIDLRVDTLPDQPSSSPSTPIPAGTPSASRPSSPPNNPASLPTLPPPPPPSSGNPSPFYACLTAGFLRQMSPLPLIWTVRTLAQGGTFSGTHAEYLSLVSTGFRFACDFVDVELVLADAEIAELVSRHRFKGTQVILSWTWTESGLSWNSREVEEMYRRAVRLGADVVRLSMPTEAPTANFAAAALQSRLAAEAGSVPLIALTTGHGGSLSLILNPILSTVSHARLARGPPELSHRELLQARVLAGLERTRTITDFGDHKLSTAFLRASVHDLGLPYDVVLAPSCPASPSPTPLVESLLASPSFGGLLLSTPLSLLPLALHHSPASLSTGHADTIYPHLPPPSLSTPPPFPLPLHSENTFALSLSSTISHHLSPVNAIGRWTSAVVLHAQGRLAREVLWALANLGVRKIYALQTAADNEARGHRGRIDGGRG